MSQEDRTDEEGARAGPGAIPGLTQPVDPDVAPPVT